MRDRPTRQEVEEGVRRPSCEGHMSPATVFNFWERDECGITPGYGKFREDTGQTPGRGNRERVRVRGIHHLPLFVLISRSPALPPGKHDPDCNSWKIQELHPKSGLTQM